MIRALILGLSAPVLLAPVALATGLEATQAVHKLVELTNADGETVIERIEADLVAPGDTVEYALSYSNSGDAPAENVALTMPVPDAISFVEGSAAHDGTTVGFSIDNGTSFASRGELEVTLDAEALTTLAQDITHIRWTFDTPIEPGVSGMVSFQGILN